MEEVYSATKTRSGRPGWSVIFRHPLRRDARGKHGLKIRRGLNTTDDAQADELVRQLNTLLSDRSWWNADRRGNAEREFAPQIVSAFFDGIEVGRIDTAQMRDARIPLPGRDDGYARVLLVGTTGAGKTTLLRHLIGSSHKHDRFPSTSTAKTTISDTEIITANGPFAAVVTFMSEFEVRAHIDECLEAACLAAIEGQSDTKIAKALLTHREERFRLSYLLGEWRDETPPADDGFEFDTVAPAASGSLDNDEGVTDDEHRANSERIENYVRRVQVIALEIDKQISYDLGPLGAQQTPDDKAAWLELYCDRLFDSEEFVRLALDIRDEVESRFSMLEAGFLERSGTGWPVLWSFESADRESFLRQVRWFSSNHSRQFGRLLTPLVDGIRVKGPFRPRSEELLVADKLVLLDGQGLGHTAESVSSISTKVTKRFGDVDMILLVDSAKQPMQAAPLALLRAAGSAGYADKVTLAFTNFDQVKGDNLQTTTQKRDHVLASIPNAVASIRQTLGAPVGAALERRLVESVFMFGGLDREIEAIPHGVVKEMGRLLQLLQSAAEPEEPAEAAPIYAVGGLELALRDAVESFLRPWEARLGATYRDGIRTEHWTRIKALSRRFANAWGDEYDNLRPASDLIGRLQEEISRWLDTPASWTRDPSDEDERMAALNPVRSGVFGALHEMVKERLADQHRSEWMTAYTDTGYGSGTRRANVIRRIYEDSAPPISSAMKPQARAFLTEVVGIVKAAVEKSGGHFEVPKTI
jgi:energy-coupling factor transporter ATP-binding protein EcfA2